MRPAGYHVDRFDLISGHVKFNRLTGVDIALLNKGMSLDDYEELPLGIVSVLALCNAGLAYVDRYLAAVFCMNEFGK